jgi:muramoyltetrapeptide carboxypeptidase
VPRTELLRGLGWVRERYRVRAAPRLLAREGYLAGSDAERALELARALADPETKAILIARGGFGAMRLLPSPGGSGGVPPMTIDLAELRRRPKWIVGFSDVTTLHVEAWAQGVASIHGPHVGALADATPRCRAAWLARLERPRDASAWSGLEVLRGGEAEGPVVGGNLTLLFSMAASGKLTMPEGAVLALEDTSERPYRVDRMLTALALGGYLRRASAIVLGGFDGCSPGRDGVTVSEVLAERTAGLGIPVLAGAPFGHGTENDAFVLGSRAVVRGSSVELGV